ncbi:hypothetical protein niasHS_016102 [Heterodera schachtii]|uniref:Uncharacterized protein n=1 Tax=Heterodera schachtii TaxID=97005 RepID=A0ABD2HZJ9_HETSC
MAGMAKILKFSFIYCTVPTMCVIRRAAGSQLHQKKEGGGKTDPNVPVDPRSVPVVTPIAKFPLGIVGLAVAILALVALLLILLYWFAKLRSFVRLLPTLNVNGGVNRGVVDNEIADPNVHPPIGPSFFSLLPAGPSSVSVRPSSALPAARPSSSAGPSSSALPAGPSSSALPAGPSSSASVQQ